MEPIIQLKGLTRQYRVGPTTVSAVAGVDLEIGRGEAVALVGPSGSGKSTLLNLLGGLDRPSSGEPKQLPTYMIPVAPTPIAAGQPIPVLDDIRMGTSSDDQIEVTGDLLGRHSAHIDRLYALRVKGLSMIDALINDGDMVILEAQETAENGQTVAAWLKAEQAATLKRFYMEDGRVRLQPANSTMQPIYTDPDNVEIKGRVIGVIRRLD